MVESTKKTAARTCPRNGPWVVRMLTANPPNIGGALETARRTIRDGNRASAVITRLRDLFRKKEFLVEPLDITEAVREVIALSWQELQRQRIILRTDFEENPWRPCNVVCPDRINSSEKISYLVFAQACARREDALKKSSPAVWFHHHGVFGSGLGATKFGRQL